MLRPISGARADQMPGLGWGGRDHAIEAPMAVKGYGVCDCEGGPGKDERLGD